MSKMFFSSLFFLVLVFQVDAWMGQFAARHGTHYRMAEAMLGKSSFLVTNAFIETKMDAGRVCEYADRCDGWAGEWPITEKDVFPMWSSIKDFDSFEAEYLTYAKQGKKEFSDGTIYLSEKLLGVVLHHIADCTVPSGHAPALTWCNSHQPLIEATAETQYVRGDNTLFPASGTDDKEYWNNYCQVFSDEMHSLADDCCKNEGDRGILCQYCFMAAMKLSNVVLLKYLLNTQEYISYHNCLPKPCEQLSFNCYSAIMVNQLTYVMRLENNMVPIPRINMEITARIPDNNYTYYNYTLYSGPFEALSYSNKIDYIKLNWPTELQRQSDGTYNNELEGNILVVAKAESYTSYSKYKDIVSEAPTSITNYIIALKEYRKKYNGIKNK